MLDWDSSLIIDNPAVDHEHLEMLVLLNLLEEAVQQRRSQKLIASILDDLLVHTRQHFTSEEEIMAVLGSPNLREHCLAHRRLTAELEEARTAFGVTGSALSAALPDYLKQWFTSHVKEMDMVSLNPAPAAPAA